MQYVNPYMRINRTKKPIDKEIKDENSSAVVHNIETEDGIKNQLILEKMANLGKAQVFMNNYYKLKLLGNIPTNEQYNNHGVSYHDPTDDDDYFDDDYNNENQIDDLDEYLDDEDDYLLEPEEINNDDNFFITTNPKSINDDNNLVDNENDESYIDELDEEKFNIAA